MEQSSDSAPSISSTAATTATPGTPTAGPAMFFAPSIVRRETLLEQTGIDSRSPDTLVIEVRVSTAHYKGTPVISSLQYRSNEEARRDCAVSFIKKDTGLALVCPTIPHYLVLRGAQFVGAVAQLSPDQREWHNQLEEH